MRMPSPMPPPAPAALGRVSALLGHDVRNPLYAMSLAVRLSDSDDDAVRDEAADLSRRALHRLDTSCVHLRLYSRWALDLIHAGRQLADLPELVERSLARTRALVDDPAVVECTVEDGLTARVDEELLQVTMDTVLHNALVHGTGTVSVDARDVEGRLRVQVRNPGTLSRPALELVDAQTTSGDADGQAGIGLGLTLATIAMDAHHGHLSIDDSDDHVTITLDLPRGVR